MRNRSPIASTPWRKDPLRSDEASLAEVVQRLVDFLLGVHDEGAVLRNRFMQRLAGDQQRFGLADRFDHHAIGLGLIRQDRQALHRYWTTGDVYGAAIHIDESVVSRRQRLGEASARG